MVSTEHASHIESVCLLTGKYTYEGVTIKKVKDGWEVSYTDPDYQTITWPKLDMAITDLISIIKMDWTNHPEEKLNLN